MSGHNSPLFQSPDDPQKAGAAYPSIKYMISRNVPAGKMLLGVPFYGKQFYTGGLFEQDTGSVPDLKYSEIADSIKSGNWNYNWDSTCMVPYLIRKDS
jgi:chitinase